jgi:hypothetical protein
MTTSLQLTFVLMSLASILDDQHGDWEACAAKTARDAALTSRASVYAVEETEFFIRNLDGGLTRDVLNVLLSIYVIMRRSQVG